MPTEPSPNADYFDPSAVLRDSVEILEIVADEREELNGEADDVLRDLIKRIKGASADPLRNAAPDMLAALKALKKARGNCGASPFEQAACNMMDAAIAKAEGRADA
jgi:hypothetical protein